MIKRFTVTGNSMMPSYHDGDVILVGRWGKMHVNDVIVCRDPREKNRLIMKRVAAIENASYYVLGDNKHASTDSRTFGHIQKTAIIGKVITV